MTLAEQQLKFAERRQKDLLLLYADVDSLKRINDTHGHHAGDLALKETGDLLRRTFRTSDVIGRVGGDEFAVLALEATPSDEKTLKMRLADALRRHNQQGTHILSVSSGVARYDHRAPCSIAELMERADKLMYAEKQRGEGDRGQDLEAT